MAGPVDTVTPAQRAAFSRVEVSLSLDLPFDVATVAPNLRWVQGLGAGVSQLLSAGLGEAGIRLTSAAGLGGIGRQVARRGHGLGMLVLACRRSATPGSTDPDVDAVFPPEDLRAMLGRCDAVVAAVPETAATVGLFGPAEFAAMRPGSIFVNVGRGSAVDEEALIGALGSGHLRAAVIDVVVAEPLAQDSPLWDVPNLYISSHCSTSADRFFANLYALFRENVRRYLDGSPLLNEVDARIGTGSVAGA